MFIDKEFYYELDEFSKLGLKAIYLKFKRKFNYNLMKEIGIQEENIITNNLCTYRDNLYSYRREKEDLGRNGAYIFVDKNRKK